MKTTLYDWSHCSPFAQLKVSTDVTHLAHGTILFINFTIFEVYFHFNEKEIVGVTPRGMIFSEWD